MGDSPCDRPLGASWEGASYYAEPSLDVSDDDGPGWAPVESGPGWQVIGKPPLGYLLKQVIARIGGQS